MAPMPQQLINKIKAQALLEAADDYYGDTHPIPLSTATWLRDRARDLVERTATEADL